MLMLGKEYGATFEKAALPLYFVCNPFNNNYLYSCDFFVLTLLI